MELANGHQYEKDQTLGKEEGYKWRITFTKRRYTGRKLSGTRASTASNEGLNSTESSVLGKT